MKNFLIFILSFSCIYLLCRLHIALQPPDYSIDIYHNIPNYTSIPGFTLPAKLPNGKDTVFYGFKLKIYRSNFGISGGGWGGAYCAHPPLCGSLYDWTLRQDTEKIDTTASYRKYLNRLSNLSAPDSVHFYRCPYGIPNKTDSL